MAQGAAKTEFPHFQRNTRMPTRRARAGSWDCQVHVFGDPQTYPPWPGRKYDAPPAYIEDMRRMHRTLGIERGLIVQPTTYGTDHTLLLDLLAVEKTYVGAAIIDDTTTDAELRRLHEGGVRSARFNAAGSMERLALRSYRPFWKPFAPTFSTPPKSTGTTAPSLTFFPAA